MPPLNALFDWLRLLSFRLRRTEFYVALAKAIDMKEPLVKFCEAELAISCNRQTSDRSRAYALRIMLRALRRGDDRSLGKTLGRVMPSSDRILLVAVDQSNDAAATLRTLAQTLRDQAAAKATLKKGLLTPLILLPGLGTLAYILSARSFPIIVKIAPPEVWTPYNAAVLLVADGIREFGLAALFAALLLIVVFLYRLPRSTSLLRLRMERLSPKLAAWLTPVAPWLLPLSMYRDFQAGMLLSALVVLLQTNKTLKESLEIIRAHSQPWMRLHIRRILRHLDDHPNEPVQAFSKGLLSPAVLARLSTLIRNTRFEDVLIAIGKSGAEDIRHEVMKTAAILNVIFLTITTSLVLFLYSGQMLISTKMKEEMDPIKRTMRELEKRQATVRSLPGAAKAQ